MARKKKSRKIGLIGVRKSPDFSRPEKEKRVKKVAGKPAGSRNNHEKVDAKANKAKQNKDPRLGSKKPVELIVKTSTQLPSKAVKRYFSPEQELAEIESDEKLATLVAKLDAGQKIDFVSQRYVDDKLSRHKQLCAMLGISEDFAADNTDDEADLLDAFENFDINKLKDF